MIRPGSFNRKGIIQRRAISVDELGEEVEAWENFVEDVWAQVMPISARGYVHGEQIADDVTHIIRFRYIAGLVAADRFIYSIRIFNFVGAPINFQDGNYMTEVRAIEIIAEPEDSA